MKIQPHYSQSSRENVTTNDTSQLAYNLGSSPLPGDCSTESLFIRAEEPLNVKFVHWAK